MQRVCRINLEEVLPLRVTSRIVERRDVPRDAGLLEASCQPAERWARDERLGTQLPPRTITHADAVDLVGATAQCDSALVTRCLIEMTLAAAHDRRREIRDEQ